MVLLAVTVYGKGCSIPVPGNDFPPQEVCPELLEADMMMSAFCVAEEGECASEERVTLVESFACMLEVL